MSKSILVFAMLILFSTFIFAMGGKPMDEPKDPMKPDSKIILSPEKAAAVLSEIKSRIWAAVKGAEVQVNFVSYDDFKMSARLWQPDAWIGNYAVEYSVKGENVQGIRRIVDRIILEMKNELEMK